MYNVGFYERKIDSVHLSVLDTFWGQKAKLVTAPVKIFIRLKLINVAHSRRVTLFFIRLLTIIDFDLNVFLKHVNLLCTGVDFCSIIRFTQRVQLLPILMFTRTATETRKRALFKHVIKSRLFSKSEYITHSLSISLMTYFRHMQLCHTCSICLT